jgi:hypothetical protein
MKPILCFLLLFFLALPVGTFAQSRTDLILAHLDRSAKAIITDSTFSKQKRDTLQLVCNVLSGQLLNSEKTPAKLFLDAIQNDVTFLDQLKNYPVNRTAKKNSELNDVINDLKLKGRLGRKGDPDHLSDELTFEVSVKVTTRKLLNQRFVPKPGYNVFVIPWIYRNHLDKKIKFPNSTNPSSTRKIAPGRYFVWVQLANPAGRPLAFPRNKDYTDIATGNEAEVAPLFIDVND